MAATMKYPVHISACMFLDTSTTTQDRERMGMQDPALPSGRSPVQLLIMVYNVKNPRQIMGCHPTLHEYKAITSASHGTQKY
jgi:hypothetical protein